MFFGLAACRWNAAEWLHFLLFIVSQVCQPVQHQAKI